MKRALAPIACAALATILALPVHASDVPTAAEAEAFIARAES